ncbi:amino acid-binding protein [Planctomycetaceae bacterium SCGC AG-212-D15]|nr:amino acid-binding protein [Planctomycetaceae bacterium SCGC AG-212-D15]
MSPQHHTLCVLDGIFSICRLDPNAPLPSWASGSFLSITRSPDELSIVCPAAVVPDGVGCERGWRCLKVQGPFDFSVVGVVASIIGPLAEAGVSVFVVSTFDTDYLLVKQERLERAVEVLRKAGHTVAVSPSAET